MKVYLAADFGRAAEVDALSMECVQAGVEVVSRWHRQVAPDEREASGNIGGPADPAAALFAAERNLTDLDSADVIVVMTTGAPARGGRHFETGYAYASGKPVIIAGPLEHAFHHLPHVEVTEVDKVAELLHALDLIPRPAVSDTRTVGTSASTAQAERPSGLPFDTGRPRVGRDEPEK